MQWLVTGSEIRFQPTYILSRTTQDDIAAVYAGLRVLLKSGMKLAAGTRKPDQFRDDLDYLKIPKEVIPLLTKALTGKRSAGYSSLICYGRLLLIDNGTPLSYSATAFTASVAQDRVSLPRLAGLKWRVDVSISTRFGALLLRLYGNVGATYETLIGAPPLPLIDP
jgi:hypothetical protein